MAQKILIADDDSDMRMIASDLLGSLGYEIDTVKDGIEVLEYLATRRPDLLVLDMSMPRLNGWDTAKRIRLDSTLADLPIVAFTAHALKGDDKGVLESGCNAYVTKPLVDDSLVETIARLLKK